MNRAVRHGAFIVYLALILIASLAWGAWAAACVIGAMTAGQIRQGLR